MIFIKVRKNKNLRDDFETRPSRRALREKEESKKLYDLTKASYEFLTKVLANLKIVDEEQSRYLQEVNDGIAKINSLSRDFDIQTIIRFIYRNIKDTEAENIDSGRTAAYTLILDYIKVEFPEYIEEYELKEEQIKYGVDLSQLRYLEN